MKKQIFTRCYLMIFLLCGFGFAGSQVEKIILTDKDGIDLSPKMEENEIFFKMCEDCDYDGKNLYLVESLQGTVFKIELETCKLERTIGSKGQGPGELAYPENIAVKNNKIFIIDTGFGGIKIFNLDGKTVTEFKVPGLTRGRGIAVDEEEHIYLGYLDRRDNTLVSICNTSGKRLRSLVPAGVDWTKKSSRHRATYQVKIDSLKNIYVLFNVSNVMEKYDKDGQLLWKMPLKNELLDKAKAPNYDTDSNMIIMKVFSFDIFENSEILIAHAYGGCILDKNGQLKTVIGLKTDLIQRFDVVQVTGDKVINVSNYNRNITILKINNRR